MSDSLRQSNTDKMSSSMKPNSQKSTLESVTDSAKSAGDSMAGKAQPESEKSTTQSASDSITGNNSKDSSKEGGSMMESASNALGMGKK